MEKANNILLKILGILLLTAAVLKGWQLLTEPVANNDIWSYRPFLILTVEFELALGLWLLSGLFKKAAWLISIGCFSLFSIITLYKGLTGAESCGCFGSVQVNPWITLFAIDLPALIALAIFRPDPKPAPDVKSGDSQIKPISTFSSLISVTTCLLIILSATTTILALNQPSKATTTYEVLEPQTWIGKPLPILDHIDIGQQLQTGNWLLLLYHHDCPECIAAIAKYKEMAGDLAGNNDFLQIALIEVPPYGPSLANNLPNCAIGKLPDTKEWFITTPATVLLDGSMVRNSWEEKSPNLDAVLKNIAMSNKLSSPLTLVKRERR